MSRIAKTPVVRISVGDSYDFGQIRDALRSFKEFQIEISGGRYSADRRAVMNTILADIRKNMKRWKEIAPQDLGDMNSIYTYLLKPGALSNPLVKH